jgi:hypothetical protein
MNTTGKAFYAFCSSSFTVSHPRMYLSSKPLDILKNRFAELSSAVGPFSLLGGRKAPWDGSLEVHTPPFAFHF